MTRRPERLPNIELLSKAAPMEPEPTKKQLASIRGQIAVNERWAKAKRRVLPSEEERQAQNAARVAEQRAKLEELKGRAAS